MMQTLSDKTIDMIMCINQKNPKMDISDIFISLFKDLDHIDEKKAFTVVKKCYLNGCKL